MFNSFGDIESIQYNCIDFQRKTHFLSSQSVHHLCWSLGSNESAEQKCLMCLESIFRGIYFYNIFLTVTFKHVVTCYYKLRQFSSVSFASTKKRICQTAKLNEFVSFLRVACFCLFLSILQRFLTQLQSINISDWHVCNYFAFA